MKKTTAENISFSLSGYSLSCAFFYHHLRVVGIYIHYTYNTQYRLIYLLNLKRVTRIDSMTWLDVASIFLYYIIISWSIHRSDAKQQEWSWRVFFASQVESIEWFAIRVEGSTCLVFSMRTRCHNSILVHTNSIDLIKYKFGSIALSKIICLLLVKNVELWWLEPKMSVLIHSLRHNYCTY